MRCVNDITTDNDEFFTDEWEKDEYRQKDRIKGERSWRSFKRRKILINLQTNFSSNTYKEKNSSSVSKKIKNRRDERNIN